MFNQNVSLTDPRMPEIERRRRLAEMLQRQAEQPIEVQSSQGIQAPISPLSVLAKGIRGYAAYKERTGAEEDAKSYAERRAKALAAIIAPEEMATTEGASVSAPSPMGGSMNIPVPTLEDKGSSKAQQIAELISMGIGEGAFEKQALNKLGFGEQMDPKDRYMNVPGVGMVDLMAEGGPKPVVRERLKGGPGDVFLDQTDAGLAPAYSVKDPNKAFNADGTPNTAYQSYELSKAATGRPSTTVNVSADKPFSSALGTGAAGILESSSNAARGGAQTISTVNQLRAALDTGKVTAGPGTTAIQFFNQVAGGDPQKLQATRATMQGLAKLTLDARGALKGQGTITDREQALLERAVSGDLDNLTIPEIRTITDVAERSARAAIKANKSNVDRARAVPGSGNVVDFYNVDEPAPYKPAAKKSGRFTIESAN